MDTATVKLHGLIMLQMSKTHDLTPYAKIRLENLSRRYGNLLNAANKESIKIDNLTGNASEIPTLDEISRLEKMGDIPNEKISWVATLDGSKKSAANNSLWGFYQKLIDIFPDIPHGCLAWATYAVPGDKLGLYVNQSSSLFTLEVKDA
jgi:hypothetical protein